MFVIIRRGYLCRCDCLQGASLIIVARSTDKLESVAEKCKELGAEDVRVLQANFPLCRTFRIMALIAAYIVFQKGFDFASHNARSSMKCA